VTNYIIAFVISAITETITSINICQQRFLLDDILISVITQSSEIEII